MSFVPLGSKGLQVQISQTPGNERCLHIIGLEHKVPVKELCEMTLFALTSTNLTDDDELLEFVESVGKLKVVEGRLAFPDCEEA